MLAAKGKEIEAILNRIPGSADVSAEQVTGQPVLQIKLNQEQIRPLRRARQGGARPRRIDRQQAAGRSDRRAAALSAGRPPARRRCAPAPEAIGSILIPTASGERLPLSRLADIRVVEGPVDDHARMGPAAHHRLGQRPRPRHRQLRRRGPAAASRTNSRCRRAATSYEFGGQFEHLQRARTRLLIVVPLALRADLRAAVPDVSATSSTRCASSPACRSAGSAASSPCGCATCRSRSRRRSASSPCPAWPCSTT